MIPGMDTLRARPPDPDPAPASDSIPAARRLPAVLAGIAGCLFLVVATSPRSADGVPPFIGDGTYSGYPAPSTLQDWLYLAAPAAATAVGLCLLRWWPYLLVAAGLMAVPSVLAERSFSGFPYTGLPLPSAGYYLAIVALLACAQGLVRSAMGWGAAVAALTLGSRVVGSAMSNDLGWILSPDTAATWHIALLVVGLVGLSPAVWLYRRGDSAATGLVGHRPWVRVRMVVVGTLAAGLQIPLSLLTTERMADLFGVSWSAVYASNFAATAVIGAITLVTVAVLAAVAGLWPPRRSRWP
jgi:hypothetical protein